MVNSLDETRYTTFSDIPGHEASGVVLYHLRCVSPTWNRTTIWDKASNMFHIFELTVRLDRNISQGHLEKSNKYASFITDIQHIKTSVTTFEVSTIGNFTPDNKKSLTKLHKFCKPGTKLSMFIKNISSLSIYSSASPALEGASPAPFDGDLACSQPCPWSKMVLHG